MHFQPVPLEVYVTGESDGKGYVWKNDAAVELSLEDSAARAFSKAVRAQGQRVYIAGSESRYGSGSRRVWNKDGSIYWSDDTGWSYAYDIAFYKGKILAACEMFNDSTRVIDANLTEIGTVYAAGSNWVPLSLKELYGKLQEQLLSCTKSCREGKP